MWFIAAAANLLRTAAQRIGIALIGTARVAVAIKQILRRTLSQTVDFNAASIAATGTTAAVAAAAARE